MARIGFAPFCVETVILPAIVYSVLWEYVLSSRNESIYLYLCVPDLHNAAPRRIARDEGEACEVVESKTDGTHRRAGFAIHVCA